MATYTLNSSWRDAVSGLNDKIMASTKATDKSTKVPSRTAILKIGSVGV